jgi:hypothetical protein
MCNSIELRPASGTAKSYKKVRQLIYCFPWDPGVRDGKKFKCGIDIPDPPHHRLNLRLDLQSLFGLHVVQLYSVAETPPPRIWAHIRGRQWSAKIDDISLLNTDLNGRYLRKILSSPPVLLLCLCQPLQHLLQIDEL